jgi:hypothetical protein
MKKENRWTYGTRDFVFPDLPANLKGRHGCSLHRSTFDNVVGEEVCAVYREDPVYADQFSNTEPFNLIVHGGLARTPHGIVAFIVWQIAAHSPHEVMMEQYLNPQNIATIRLVASAANQTHFKLIVINNQTAETVALVDFENVFQFDELVSGMALAIGHEPEGDFAAASQHMMRTMTVPELVTLSLLQARGEQVPTV